MTSKGYAVCLVGENPENSCKFSLKKGVEHFFSFSARSNSASFIKAMRMGRRVQVGKIRFQESVDEFYDPGAMAVLSHPMDLFLQGIQSVRHSDRVFA